MISTDNFEKSLQQLKHELLYEKNTELFNKKNATYMFKAFHDISVLGEEEGIKITLITSESKEKLLSKKIYSNTFRINSYYGKK